MNPKKILQQKLIYSFAGLAMLLLAAATYGDWFMGLSLAVCFTLATIQQEKIPRHLRALKSTDLVVIRNRWTPTRYDATLLQKILGWTFLGIVGATILAAGLSILTDPRLGTGISRIFLISAIVFLGASSPNRLIIFDYSRATISGLWKAPSSYDSSLEFMREIKYKPIVVRGNDGLRIWDNGEDYDIFKRNYQPDVWEEIVVNLERVRTYRESLIANQQGRGSKTS